MKKILVPMLVIAVSIVAFNYMQRARMEGYIKRLSGPDRECVGCNLSGMSLRGYDLSGFDLTNAKFVESDLRCVDFSRANLTGANLKNANITGAILAGATLRRSTDMTGVVWNDGSSCGGS